jgi:protease-4
MLAERWMMRPEKIRECAFAIAEATHQIQSGLNVDIEDFFVLRNSANLDPDGIGHVYITGALMQSVPAIYEKLGMVTRYPTIISESQELIAGGAKGIMYHVNSPGGGVMGCAEAAEFLAGIQIPTMSHCQGLACSAAYKLTSRTDRIVSTVSSEIGNIGVILSWADCSVLWQAMGIEWKAITNAGADLKSTFHLEPDENQLAYLQDDVNDEGKAFRSHVEMGRNKAGATLSDEVWRAGWYSGEKAIELGLVDEIGAAEDARQWFLSSL